MTFPNLLAAAAAPWAVRPDSLPQLRSLLATAQKPETDLTAAMGQDRPGMGALARGVAVLPVRGFLLNRCNPFEEFFGCCSVERLSASLDMLLNDDAVTAVILSFDSPGGSVLGIEELSRKILAVRDTKPVVAMIDALSASAAYWLASACTDVWCTPSGMVGSIGTLMVRYDCSAANAEEGVAVNVISSGTYKAEGIPDLPMTDEERAAIQAMCDSYYTMFTSTVAKGRETTTAAVKAGFGEGRVVTAKDALAEGMIDRIGTMGDVLGKYAGRSKGGVRALRAAPTGLALVAAAHGIAAKTPTDVMAAISGILIRPFPPVHAAETDGATEPAFAVGDRVRVLVEHGMGTIGRLGEVTEAHAGDPPYYAVLLDGEEMPHKWFTEKELEVEEKDKNEAAEGATASADPVTPATAPQAKESAMPEPTNGAAPTSGADATQMNQRSDAIMALALKHGKDMPWAIAQAKSGRTLDQIEAGLEMMAEQRRKLDEAPDLSPTGAITVGEPNEGKRPFGSAEYVALAAKVRAGSLPKTDETYQRAHAAAFGEFLAAVRDAHSPGSVVDPRLSVQAAATGMGQATPADGGYGVLPQFASTIYEGLVSDVNSLLSMTDNYTVSGESLTFPANAETSRATGSRFGGVRGYWINEADQITKSKPTLRQVKIEPQQLAVLTYLTEKLIRNNGVALGQFVQRAATEEIAFLVGEAIFKGTGVGQPKGLLPGGVLGGSTIQVSKESSQAAATFNKQNANKMWARLHPRSQGTAVWLMNIDVSPQLDEFSTPIKNVAGTENVGGFGTMIYNAERNTLKGRPIIYTEFCPTLGSLGDVVLWDPRGYVTGTRGDGVLQDMSMHVRFEYAEQAFRWMFEVDGQQWLQTALTPNQGSNTLSHTVALQAR